MPVKTGTYDHALSITYLLKSMSVVSQLVLTVQDLESLGTSYCEFAIASRSSTERMGIF